MSDSTAEFIAKLIVILIILFVAFAVMSSSGNRATGTPDDYDYDRPVCYPMVGCE